ncbi:MAG: ABC transporter permease [Clostridia bacterium]|nr:ABC transporter permease [Clostridia bacterium]
MKKAYARDSRKMFKNNLFRFISIVLIIMLGTAFFIGMNSVSPVMEQVAEKYMKEQNIFDISITSNLGYKPEDIELFQQNEHVNEIKGEYTYDALTSFGEKDIVVRFSSIKDDLEINKNDIFEGRNVENDNECLISSRLNTMYGYEIGDKIKVYRKDDTNIDDYLKYTEFEIVGITRNPIYLSKFYGNTTLLTGELNGYVMVKEEAFNLEEYTTVNIKIDIDENINKFSDEYKEKNSEILKEIEEINNSILAEKYNKIYEEYSNEINETEEAIKKVEQTVEEIYSNILNSQLQINLGIVNVSENISAYYNSNNIYERNLERANSISNLYASLGDLENQKEDLEDICSELKYKTINLQSELEELENKIDKNLYEIYALDNEELKFVNLSKENNKLYYEYNQKNSEYESISKEYETKTQELEEVNKSIEDTNAQIDNLQNELYSAFNGQVDLIYGIGSQTLIAQVEEIKQGIEELNQGKKELEEQNIKEKIQSAKEVLNDKKDELNKFKVVSEETPLYENSGFKSLKEDLEKIAIMGKIFPVMFFVIAALVTITTITRMIEEDRKNIGTLKALGYSKGTIMSRYIIYSLLAGVLGTVLGTAIGSTLIVQILFVSYSSLYDLPNLVFNINWYYTLISLGISLISTAFVATIITMKEIKENTAELMRPKTATTGKSILLEKIPFIWKKLDFLFKICFRNIFRYKRRLLMTLIGIAGCTALIYAGLGLQSAINSISNKQFKDVRKLSMEIYLQGDINSKEISDIEEYVKKQSYIKEIAPVSQKSITVQANGSSKDVFYIAISGTEVDKYIGLNNRKSKEKIELNDEGVVLTEKLANILEVDVGEKIEITDGEVKTSVKVIGITENYLYNFVYFTPNVYERIYGKNICYNEIFVNTTENLSEEQEIELADALKQNEKIASTVLEKNLAEEFKTSLGSLMSIVILFIGCASILSFTVLINLNNINIEERKRELATIKLLGFYQKELESYVFRENIILTILGTIFGLFLGMGILGAVIQAAEVETIFLVKDINLINLVISTIITICFTLITNLLMKKKIKNINMIDSLKSIE